MIDELVSGMLFVAASDLKDKITRTALATPAQKLGAIMGGFSEFYCEKSVATNELHSAASDVVDAFHTIETQ